VRHHYHQLLDVKYLEYCLTFDSGENLSANLHKYQYKQRCKCSLLIALACFLENIGNLPWRSLPRLLAIFSFFSNALLLYRCFSSVLTLQRNKQILGQEIMRTVAQRGKENLKGTQMSLWNTGLKGDKKWRIQN
jgi:hypothetical protein